MVYTPNVYTSYDKSKTFEENKANGAVIEADKMNVLEQQVSKNADDIDSLYEKVVSKIPKDERMKILASADWAASTWQISMEEMQNAVDTFILNGYDGIIISFHVYFDAESSLFKLAGDLDLLKQGIDYAIDKRLSVYALKLHGFSSTDEVDSVENFEENYITIIDQILDFFDGYCNYIFLNNEVSNFTQTKPYTDFTIAAANHVKNKGYYAGVSVMGKHGCVLFSDDVIDVLDCIGINDYPVVSFSGNPVAYSEFEEAFAERMSKVEWIQRRGLEIWITESGVLDYWECLANPSKYIWGGIDCGNADFGSGLNADTDYSIGYLWLSSLIDNYKNTATHICTWFNETFCNNRCSTLIAQYKGVSQ